MVPTVVVASGVHIPCAWTYINWVIAQQLYSQCSMRKLFPLLPGKWCLNNEALTKLSSLVVLLSFRQPLTVPLLFLASANHGAKSSDLVTGHGVTTV